MKDLLETAALPAVKKNKNMSEVVDMTKRLYHSNTHVNFVFPSGWSPSEDIKQEAAERFNTRPNFPMPFPRVAVLLDSGAHNATLFGEGSYINVRDNTALLRESCYVFIEQDGDSLIAIVCSRSENRNDKGYYWTTCLPVGVATLDHGRLTERGEITGLSFDIALFESSLYAGNADQSLDEPLRKTVMEYATAALGALWSLMAKGVETTEEPASPKLDRKNAGKGLPKTSPYVKVRINEPTRTYHPGNLGGTHASPRPHWRRGHLRKLGDGRDTYVRPTLVGGESGSYCGPGLRMYKCELASLGHTT